MVASIPLTNRELSPTVGGNPADHSCVPRLCCDSPSRLSPANPDGSGGERVGCLGQRAARLQDPPQAPRDNGRRNTPRRSYEV
jgi:hypothetical protein